MGTRHLRHRQRLNAGGKPKPHNSPDELCGGSQTYQTSPNVDVGAISCEFKWSAYPVGIRDPQAHATQGRRGQARGTMLITHRALPQPPLTYTDAENPLGLSVLQNFGSMSAHYAKILCVAVPDRGFGRGKMLSARLHKGVGSS